VISNFSSTGTPFMLLLTLMSRKNPCSTSSLSANVLAMNVTATACGPAFTGTRRFLKRA